MSYIFRLHKEGNNTINGWENSGKYGTSIIDQIQDPNGDSAKREITSIPSPFARIDLVKTAFKKVADGDVDGNDIHHKMVSDALDVAQIFFEYEKFKDKVEIITWDKDDCIKKLIQSTHESHRQFGEVLRTYNEQDGRVYNFDKMDRMFLLNYIDGPNKINIIGATSPSTLFFTPANDLSYVKLGAGQDVFFDDGLMPLYRRDIEFQIYIYSLSNSIKNFASIFKDVDKYLQKCLAKLDDDKRRIIKQITPNDYETNYSCIAIDNNAGNTVSILKNNELNIDIELRCRKQSLNSIADTSGFVIDSEYRINGVRPLVLPVEPYSHKTTYTQDIWNKNTKVPYFDSLPESERTLPDDGAKYPYLTIGDFLTDSIVRMPYEIDNLRYFDGNSKKSDENSYLLPLTDKFFNFFTVDDLLTKSVEGKKMFEFENNATGVTAILRIPIRSGLIEYRRIYFESVNNTDEARTTNGGAMFDNKIGLGIMPFVKFPEDVDKHYRIAMYDKCRSGKASLVFMDKNSTLDSKNVICSEKDTSLNVCGHESYIVENNFDRIKVNIGGVTGGYIIPRFKNGGGGRQFTFAVDYGTTNTHIEYCTDTNRNPLPFVIEGDECQLRKMHTKYTDPDIRMGFIQDFIPDTIGDNEYSFPMRTVYAKIKNINFNKNPMAFAEGHIPFLYEKDFIPKWNDINTEMKWGGVDDKLLEMHIETIFMMLRNKVVLNEGSLNNTKIAWFFPASMTEDKVIRFRRFWNSAYKKYFGANAEENIRSISESIAPYFHFTCDQGAAEEIVTIDIGGGTTDVLVVQESKPKMLMSFRYASNAIFGDSYNSNPAKNGFVSTYLKTFEDILKDNGLQELSQALIQIKGQNKSSDIIAFLFSLQGDKVKNNPELNFLKKLENNDKLQYVFIVFYSSIFYFIAKSMKANGLIKPKTIAFSGNGSNTLHILSTDNGMISRFVKLIFDKVYGDNKGAIEVMMECNPKIATCKGGIRYLNGDVNLEFDNEIGETSSLTEYEKMDKIRTVIVGNNFDTNEINKYIKYGDVAGQLSNDIIVSVKDFFKFLFDLHKDNKEFLTNKLGANNSLYNTVKEFCLGEEGRQILEVSLSKGYKKKLEEVNGDKEKQLEDTLFFYPLVGLLHDLAWKISNM